MLDAASDLRTLHLDSAYEGLFAPFRHKAFHGGRGSAKSHSFATVLAARASQERLRIVCGRQFQNSIADSVKELIEQKIETHDLQEHFYPPTRTEIVSKSGSRFSFIGMERNPNSSKSLEGCDIFWGEEAQTFSDYSIEIIIPTVRKPGSELWWSWNPEDPDQPIDSLMRGPAGPPPRSLVQEVSYKNNPYFHLTELPAEMEAMRQRDEQKYNHIWLGQYRNLTDSQVFKNWRVGRVEITQHDRPRFGLDFGFSEDPNALVKLYVLPATASRSPTIYIAQEAHAHRVPNERLPALLDTVTESRRYRIVADSARPETIDQLQRDGFRVSAAKKGPNSVADGVSWMQGYDIVIDPDCPHTADEFKRYSHQVDRRTGDVLPVIVDAHNHHIDAVRYATEEDRRGGGGPTIRKVSFGRNR